MPQDIDDCVSAMEGKVDNPYAFCNWAKENGKGPFAHAESVDFADAVREFKEGQRKDVIPGVEIFRTGHWQGDFYTEADLDEIVDNYERNRHLFEPPLKVGHENDQKELLENTGTPAVGWVVGLRRDGPKLLADLSQIDPDIGDLIQAGAYRHVSAELYDPDKPPEGADVRGWGLKGVAILGGKLPHIKSLKWLADRVRQHAEVIRTRHAPRVRLTASRRIWQDSCRTWACFSEVSLMAEDAVQQVANAAIAQQFPGLPPEFIDSLTPDQMGMLAPAIAPEAPEAPGGEGDVTGMVEWPPDAPSKEDVVAALVAQGEDQANLMTMTDEELVALYQQKMGGGTAPFAEEVPTVAGAAVSTPTPVKRQPTKVTTTQQFAEELAELNRGLTQAQRNLAEVQRKQRQADRLRNEEAAQLKRSRIASFCEEMVGIGYLTPAEVDVDKAGNAVGPVISRLLRADALKGVKKFGEKIMTELDLQMEEIRTQGKKRGRHFGERVPDPLKQTTNFSERVEKHYEGRLKRINGRAGNN